MQLYHFIDANFGIINILNRRLKISRIGKLNDPYELRGVVAEEEVLKDGLERVRESSETNFGIISFSNTYEEPLLWSYYADQHKGICLGFEVEDHEAVKIVYQNEPIKLRVSDFEYKKQKEKVELIHKTKYYKWSHESEFRIFTNLKNIKKIDGFHFLNFGKKLKLNEIILGHKCIMEVISLQRSLGENIHEVDIYKARMSEYEYKILRQKISI